MNTMYILVYFSMICELMLFIYDVSHKSRIFDIGRYADEAVTETVRSRVRGKMHPNE